MCKKVYFPSYKSISSGMDIFYSHSVVSYIHAQFIKSTPDNPHHSGPVIEPQLLTSILFLPTSQLQLDGNHASIFNLTFTDHRRTVGFNCSWTRLIEGDLGTVTLSWLSYYEPRTLWEMVMASLEGRRGICACEGSPQESAQWMTANAPLTPCVSQSIDLVQAFPWAGTDLPSWFGPQIWIQV